MKNIDEASFNDVKRMSHSEIGGGIRIEICPNAINELDWIRLQEYITQRLMPGIVIIVLLKIFFTMKLLAIQLQFVYPLLLNIVYKLNERN